MNDRGAGTLESVIAEADRLSADGHQAAAAQLYENWIAANESPARCVALFNLGVLRADRGDLDGAESAYAEAVALNPQFYQARINAGLVAERKQQDVEAVRHWLAVAAFAVEGLAEATPFATVALNHIGRLQESRRHYAAAESALAHSLQLNPAQPDAIQHWVHLRQKQCSWPLLHPLPGIAQNKMLAAISPLAMLALHDDPALQWLTAHLFVSRKYKFPEVARPPAKRAAGSRMHIGYLSGDLCTHAVGLLMAELLEAHDRNCVRVTAFDFSPEDGTAHRARLRRACDEMVPVHAMSDAAVADVIRARGVEVLIDLHGLSSGARPGILALRPAPLIGTYLGFIGTTALPWIDFVVTDAWTMPETVTPYMTERALYIDGSMIPLFHQPVTGGRFARHQVGLPAGAVVLACFNNIYKITPEMLACWLRILQQAENTVLWLLDDNAWASAVLRKHVEAAGIDPSRLILSGRSTHAEYREKLTLADLYLDTYPYNAGSTARDVLDAGVPLVTLSGRTPVSRMAGGMLHAAGLDALIATSWSEYESLIVQLAGDTARRRSLKALMQERSSDWRHAPGLLVRSLESRLSAMLNKAH